MSSTTPNEIKAYPAYKKSGVEWLGNVPEHWEVRRIKSLSVVRRGASPRPIDDARYFDEHGEFAWVRISDVTASDRYLYKTTQRLSELGQSLSVELNPGSLFLSIAGSVGKPIITKIKCCIHDGFVYFSRFRGDVEFLYRVLSTDAPFSGLGKFGTQLNLNTDTVGNIYIGWPPSDEQAAIVRYLDHVDQRIRAYVSAKERLIALLEEERQTVIQQAVTRGLDPNVNLKHSGVEWLGDVPEHWEIRPLKRWVSTKITDGPHETPDFLDDGIPFMSAESMVGGRLDFSRRRGLISREQHELYCRKCRPQINDIFMCKSGATTGKVAIVDTADEFSVWSPLALIRVDPQKVFAHLLFAVLQASYVQQQVEYHWSYGTQPNLAMNTMERIAVMLPPIAEQRELLAYLGQATKKTSEAISRAHRQIDLFQEYRIRLIADVVTGKMDVRVTV